MKKFVSCLKHIVSIRFALALLLLVFTLGIGAQQHKKKHPPFNPEKFEAEIEQFITQEAGLSPAQAAKFFPVYRQMTKRQRSLFTEMRRFRHVTPNDDKACADAIRKQDELDLQIKQLQQEYHSRFMLILPASKVLEVIKAEDKFHRQMFRKMR